MKRRGGSTRRIIDQRRKETKNAELRVKKETPRYSRKTTHRSSLPPEISINESTKLPLQKSLDGLHRCKICGIHFDRSCQLKSHLLEHGSERPFPCFTCNIRFTTKWNLMKHQNCRSHRVVLAKVARNEHNNEERPSKVVPIKKRRIDWFSDSQLNQPTSASIEKEETKGQITASVKSVHLSTLPSASQTLAQLGLNPEERPPLQVYFGHAQTIAGKLIIPLSDQISIDLSVGLTFDEVDKFYSLSSVDGEKDEVKPSEIINDAEQNGQHFKISTTASNSTKTTTSTTRTVTTMETSNNPIVSRSHEEIQAAKTILSLSHPTNLKSNLPTSPKSPNLMPPKLRLGDQSSWKPVSPTPLHQCASTTVFHPTDQHSARTFCTTQHQAPFLIPHTSTSSIDSSMTTTMTTTTMIPKSPSPPILVEQPAVCDNFPFEPVQCVPRPVKPRPAIRAPPKKRHAIQYDCSMDPITTVMDMQFQTNEPRQSISFPSITSTTSTAISEIGSTLNTIVSIPSESVPIRAFPVNSDCSRSNISKLATITVANPISAVPYNPPRIPSSQNFFILPPFMVLPRIINPYVSVATSQALVNTCLLFPTDVAMRATTICSSVTNSLVTPIPTPIRTLTPSTISNQVHSLHPLVSTPRLSPNPSINMIQGEPFIPLPSSNMAPQCVLPRPIVIAPSSTGEHNCQKPCEDLSRPTLPACVHTQPTILPSIAPNTLSPRNSISTRLASFSPSTTTTDGLRTTVSTRSESCRLVTILPATKESTSVRAFQPIQSQPDLSSNRHQPRPCNPTTPPAKKILPTQQSQQRLIHPKLPPATTRLLINRNKYRCFECGLVCHKPCLLRKHYRTHSNVRPYLCPHCDISFKTRGNLSKHMKSRGHIHRCVVELGHSNAPLTVDDATQVDRQALEKQRQLVFKRDSIKRDSWRSRTRNIKANVPTLASMKSIANPASSLSGRRRNLRPQRHSTNWHARRSTNKSKPTIKLNDTESTPMTQTTESLEETKALASTTTTTTITTTVEANGRHPAPNVNAVHLLQDLPLNLSVHPRQPITGLIPQKIDLAHHPQSSVLTADSHLPTSVRPDLTNTEKMVQTAVEVARTFKQDSTLECPNTSKNNSDLRPTTTRVSEPPCFRQDANSGIITMTTDLNVNPPKSSSFTDSEMQPNFNSNESTPSSTTWTNGIGGSNPIPTTSSNTTLPSLRRSQTINGKTRSSKSSDSSRDPRPYKCSDCRIGFRVSGHLYKHYRSKSHLLTILQLQQVPAETLEVVRQSRVTGSQIVNPDTGQLRLRGLERLLVMKTVNAKKLPCDGTTDIS